MSYSTQVCKLNVLKNYPKNDLDVEQGKDKIHWQ